MLVSTYHQKADAIKQRCSEKRSSRILLQLLCVALFGGALVETIIPNGTTYVTGIVGILAALCCLTLQCRRRKAVKCSWGDVLFVAYVVMTLVNAHTSLEIGLWTSRLSMLMLWWCVRQLEEFPWRILGTWAMIAGVVQTSIGVMQALGLVASHHHEFSSTGSFHNPGIWGGYQALMLALALSFVGNIAQQHCRRWGYVACGYIALGVLLSASRAALVAVAIGMLVACWRRRSLRWKRRLLWLAVSLFPLVSYLIYCIRPESVAARGFIWRVGLNLFESSPFVGHGSGGFAARYMLEQANFLEHAPTALRQMADDNVLAFNDLLRVLCEQGVVGVALLVALGVCVAYALWQQRQDNKQQRVVLPLVVIAVFSLFSYPGEVWSLWSFLPLLTASVSLPLWRSGAFPTMLRWGRSGITLGICMLLGIILAAEGSAQRALARYAALTSQQPGTARQLWVMHHDAFLQQALVASARLVGDDARVVREAERLGRFVQTARWQLQIGESYEAIGCTHRALQCYRTAHLMMPGLLLPLYAQFSLHRTVGSEAEARKMATEILHHKSKKNNNEVQRMKQAAANYLKHQ